MGSDPVAPTLGYPVRVSRVPTDASMRLRVRTTSAAGTRALGAWLAGAARPGDRIALSGPLGAGKTQLAKGFAQGLGVPDVVSSPSFTLMAEYHGRLPLFHQDLYRLEDARDALAGGLLDERQDLGVTIVEWADRLGEELGSERLEVRLGVPLDAGQGPGLLEDAPDALPDEPREIVLSASTGHARYLERARSWPGEAVS